MNIQELEIELDRLRLLRFKWEYKIEHPNYRLVEAYCLVSMYNVEQELKRQRRVK